MKIDTGDFADVRNRYERYVLMALEEFLATDHGRSYQDRLSAKDLQGIYAVTLNYLPARYIQPTTILLNSPTRAQEVAQAVKDAFEGVVKHDRQPGRKGSSPRLDAAHFAAVRNRNEKLVFTSLENFLVSDTGKTYREWFSVKDLQDIYALALNYLPSRYELPGASNLNSPLRSQDADKAVLDAFELAFNHPRPAIPKVSTNR